MDKLRLYVWIALAAALYLSYLNWQTDYPPPAPPAPAPIAAAPTDALPPLPGGEAARPETQPVAAPTPAAPVVSSAPTVIVRTDVLDVEISTQGGELQRADLLRYPASKKEPNKVVRLFDAKNAHFYLARSGLLAVDERSAPTHQALYTTPQREYRLGDADTVVVPLIWTNGEVTVTKTYTFKRGSYIVELDYQIDNRSANEWQAASYVQLIRRQPIIETSILEAESYAFMGPSIYDGKASRNLKLDDEDSRNFGGTFTGGWMAAMQHHFVTAAVPDPKLAYEYQLSIDSPQQFMARYRGPMISAPPGGQASIHETFFIGPKLQKQLESVGSRLELTADYGMLTIVAQPLFKLLSWVHDFVGNWGWSIIIVTLLIKLAFYKLTEASGKSMARMKEVAPRLKALQERYKDDREQLGRATMEFYKREKINPLGGCLPTLIQMPVFMAFYWVILNSAEMRQAPFIGYLTDLSSRDPYFILPLILGAANFAQFKLNPAPADPVQAKVMMLMPILMTAMMVLFPSGLVLYWITNTGLSILQQWHINRVVAAQAKKT